MRKRYILFIALSLGVGGLSALLTMGNMDLYSEITRPPLSPPSILFPIVWTVLYILMGIGAAMVWNNRSRDLPAAKSAIRIYAIQLAVNLFWSLIFFNLRAFLLAFIWLLLLWMLIVMMISRFSLISVTAGKLQIPYLIWVTFAGYLNLAIYFLNR